MMISIAKFVVICFIQLFNSFVFGLPLTKLNNVTSSGQKLIIILVDGMRWDYPREPYIKGLNVIAENGVRAEFVYPTFPSNSYPNWYSIATGESRSLYTGRFPENHGIIDNFMYDPVIDSFFYMGKNSEPQWWNQAEPLWITAQTRGLQTAVLWWDGCQVKLSEVTLKECRRKSFLATQGFLNRDFARGMSNVLNQMAKDELQLAMSYYGPVDGEGHRSGPNSYRRKQATRDIDSMIFNLQQEMKVKNLTDKVNLIVVSDHGMTDSSAFNVIDIQNIVNSADIKYMVHGGAEAYLLPFEGKLEKVYEDLKKANIAGLTVYKKEDIPDHFGIKNSDRTLPILLVADLGYSIKAIRNWFKVQPMIMNSVMSYVIGTHGYDPYRYEYMRTIFYGRGPGFKSGYVGEPIRIVDEYNLFCKLLGIKPLANDGDWSKVSNFLKETTIN